MKLMQGKVVCTTNDKTVVMEIVWLAPHSKYKRRLMKKKKHHVHDPENQCRVGDIVQLLKSRPISKIKTFLAVSVPKKDLKNKPLLEPKPFSDIRIPLESQQ